MDFTEKEKKAMELFPHVYGDRSSENFIKYHVWLAGHRYAEQSKNKLPQDSATILDLAISEIEKQKFDMISGKSSSVKVGLTDALGVLNFLKEEHYIECDCGHVAEHKYTHTNEEGNTTCSLCVIEYLQSK